MAAKAIKWETPASETVVIRGDATAPTLKNLANNGQKLGSEFDNQTNKHRWAEFQLKCRGAVAFAATGYVELYLIYSSDGTTYADGDDTVAPSINQLVAVSPVRAVSTQQELQPIRVPLLPLKGKPLIVNKGGQAFTNTDGENELVIRTFNEELQ